MKIRDGVELLILAAVWGASFLFMRIAAPEFGPVALIALRVAVAALCLLPLLVWQQGLSELRRRWAVIGLLGLLNSALPFCLFAYAALSVSAGFSAILNATTPLWGGLIAYFWLGEKLSFGRILGLGLGIVGVATLVAGHVSFKPGGSGFAVVAVMLAALLYGLSATYTKRYLTGVNSLVLATGSQLSAAIVLLPLALWLWPATPPSARAWGATLGLGLACTALAYILFFRLIARVGPSRTIAVTFLIPIFATVWGALFLDEAVTRNMWLGGGIILVATALATGLIEWRRTSVRKTEPVLESES